jgi:hypothetical protein
MNILEVCHIIRLCRVLGSVRLGRTATEEIFPNKRFPEAHCPARYNSGGAAGPAGCSGWVAAEDPVRPEADVLHVPSRGDIAWPFPWVLPLVIPAWLRLPLRRTRIAHLVLLFLLLTPVGVCCLHRFALTPLFRLSPMHGSYLPC